MHSVLSLIRPNGSVVGVVAIGALLLLAACSDADSEQQPQGDDRVVVASSFPILSELVVQIGGDRVDVLNLIPLGVDEHAYQPPTTLPRDIARADLVMINGYALEEGLLQIVAQNVREGVPVIEAARGLDPLEGEHEHGDEEHEDEEHEDEEHEDEEHEDEEPGGDPHFWLDARNMAVYAANVRDALIDVDPEGADRYRTRASGVIAELEALHDELLTTLSTIPTEQRRLVVFHNAFQYFAAAYDFEVIATVAPANPNQARSAAAIADVIEIVRAAGVPAIFREPQYQSQSLDLIADDSGTTVGIIHSVLSPDVPTYAEMMRANAAALVEGLMSGG